MKNLTLQTLFSTFALFSLSARAELFSNGDCKGLRDDGIMCSASGQNYLSDDRYLDIIPRRIFRDDDVANSYVQAIRDKIFRAGDYAWSWLYINKIYGYSPLQSDAQVKQSYLEFISYLRKNNLSLTQLNIKKYRADRTMNCAVDLLNVNYEDNVSRVTSGLYSMREAGKPIPDIGPDLFKLNWRLITQNPNRYFPTAHTPLDAVKLCNETDQELIRCGLRMFNETKKANQGFEWMLTYCKSTYGYKGSVQEIMGKGRVSQGAVAEEVKLPSSYLEAWKILAKSDVNSLEQVESIRSIMIHLNLEWLSALKSKEFSTRIYEGRNRVLAPLFFHTLNQIQKIELTRRIKMKIDLSNNFDLIFEPSPEGTNTTSIKSAIHSERAEIRRLIEGI